MDREMLVVKARRHWEMWLPKKTRKLKDAGQFDTAIQVAVTRAYAEVTKLVTRGYQEREAKEIAFPKYVCLRPEPKEYE